MGFFGAVKNIFGGSNKTKKRVVDEFQIEIVHLDPSGSDEAHYMEQETFEKAANYFELAKTIRFTGWGDSLSHPKALAMIQKAKESNKKVEVTTTGSPLNPELCKSLLEAELDLLKINLYYPQNTLDQIAENLKTLLEKRSNNFPKVILDFTMTTENIRELPQFMEAAGDLKVDEVVASNIDFILDEKLNSLKVFKGKISNENRGDLIKQGKAKGKAEYEDLAGQAEKIANRKRMYFSLKPLVANEAVMCEYSPLSNVFVNWHGKVAPCPCLALENSQSLKRYFNDLEYDFQPFIIGDINSADFMDLWNNSRYADFRKIYKKRVDIFNRYMEETFEEEPSASLLTNNYQKLEEQLAKNKLPEVCTRCYKAYGV
jgi:MoaA/NifB/PqqE/SkfB family radical SAM enzyme